MANSNGTPENLVASHPRNTNAEKGGAHSPRRHAERQAAVQESFQVDPVEYLRRDRIERFAQLRGHLDLVAADLTKKGVSDSSGNLRRTASHFLTTYSKVEEAEARLREDMSSDEIDMTCPDIPRKDELLARLWEMAQDPTKASGPSVTAAIVLLRDGRIADVDDVIARRVAELSDPELERQLDAWLAEVTTYERAE
jgi:hypothetical protein